MDSDITHTAIAGGVLVAAGFGLDYLQNGPNSILGKLLGLNVNQNVIETPLRFGETSTSPYEVPVPTLRAPLPTSTQFNTDPSGALYIPQDHSKKKVRAGLSSADIDVAAWEIAKTVFEDMQPYEPPVKMRVGDTQKIHDDLVHIMHSHDCPEILLKVAHFHKTHGHQQLGSVLMQTQSKIVGTAADGYEDMMGVPRMYSRMGDLNASEYDSENDRLASMGSDSSIFWKVQNAWPAY